MLVDRSEIEEFPFHGKFYRSSVDKSGGLKAAVQTRTLVLETECDIQEARSTTFTSSTYVIYFPISVPSDIPIRIGDTFEGDMYGISINGVIAGMGASELGGCMVYIKDVSFLCSRIWKPTLCTFHELCYCRIFCNIGDFVTAEDERLLIDIDAVFSEHLLHSDSSNSLDLSAYEFCVFL